MSVMIGTWNSKHREKKGVEEEKKFLGSWLENLVDEGMSTKRGYKRGHCEKKGEIRKQNSANLYRKHGQLGYVQ
jgi:hypothetical protein